MLCLIEQRLSVQFDQKKTRLHLESGLKKEILAIKGCKQERLLRCRSCECHSLPWSAHQLLG